MDTRHNRPSPDYLKTSKLRFSGTETQRPHGDVGRTSGSGRDDCPANAGDTVDHTFVAGTNCGARSSNCVSESRSRRVGDKAAKFFIAAQHGASPCEARVAMRPFVKMPRCGNPLARSSTCRSSDFAGDRSTSGPDASLAWF